MKTYTARGVAVLTIAVVVASLATGCLIVPPPPLPPPRAQVTVYEEGPVVPAPVMVAPVLLPPPVIVLPPAPVVVYSPVVRTYVVSGLGPDVFYVDGYFYTHHHDHWYCAPRPGAGWVVVDRPHVPRVLAQGPPPPGWNRSLVKGEARHITKFKETLPFPVPPPPPPPGAAVKKARGKGPATAIAPPSGVTVQPEKPGKRTGQVTKPIPPGQLKKQTKPGAVLSPLSPGDVGEPTKNITTVAPGLTPEGAKVAPGKVVAPGQTKAKSVKASDKKKKKGDEKN